MLCFSQSVRLLDVSNRDIGTTPGPLTREKEKTQMGEPQYKEKATTSEAAKNIKRSYIRRLLLRRLCNWKNFSIKIEKK